MDPMSCQCFATLDNVSQECRCSNIYQFIATHNLWFNKKEGDQREITHLDMSGFKGGQYCIPCGAIEDYFTKLYIRDEAEGRFRYCIEKRSNVFQLFMDVDEKTYSPDWADVDRVEYVTVIQNDIKRFFPTLDEDEYVDLLTVVICTAENAAQQISGTEGNAMKIGLHLHFPNLRVTDHEAKLIRASSVVALERQIPFEKDARVDGGWSEVLDECVYDANGLRMLGSCKLDVCSECKKKTKAEKKLCVHCKGVGRIPALRPYKAQCLVRGNGEIDEEATARLSEDFEYALSLVKIRTPPNATPDQRFKRYEGCPSYKNESLVTRGKQKGCKRFHQDDESAKAIGLNGSKDQMLITSAIERVLKGLISQIHAKYDNLQILDATWLGKGNKSPCLCVRVSGEGSSWCGNVERDHSQNTIYFTVTPNGISQRCFSRKQRASGVCCRDYCSNRIALSSAEHMILFGTSQALPPNTTKANPNPPKSRLTHKSWTTSNGTKEIEQLILTVLAPSWDKRKPHPSAPKRHKAR